MNATGFSRNQAPYAPRRDTFRARKCSPGFKFENILLRAAVAAGFFASLTAALAAEPLTSLRDLYSLNRSEALESRPFRFRGLVLCYDSEWNQLFVRDDHDTVYFDPNRFTNSVTPGQRIEITASSTWLQNQAALTNLSLTVVGESTLPTPRKVDFSQLASANGEWIQTEARVRVAETSKGKLGLLLQASEHECLAYVMGPLPKIDSLTLIGSTISLKGILTSTAQDGKSVATIIVPGISQIKVLERATVSPRSLPVISIEALLTRSLGPWTNDPVRVQGTVLTAKPAEQLVLKDPTGTLRAQVIQGGALDHDTRVNVWGYLRLLPDETVLEDAFYEIAPVDAAQAARNTFQSTTNTNAPHLPITRITTISKLTSKESAQGYPVQLHGVITYADPQWRAGFIQDNSGAIYFPLTQTNIKAGDWVELSGQTAPGTFAPVISNTSLRALTRTNFPTAIKADLQDVADGHLDARWVELEGLVQRVDTEPGHIRLSLISHQGRFHAVVPSSEPFTNHLVDARVRLRGVCGAELNSRNQLSGILLHIPSVQRIKIQEPPPEDPFSIPARPVAAVATFDPDLQAGHRLKLAGTIIFVVPGQAVFLQDPTGGIRLRTADTEAFSIGTAVEVLGFPILGDFAPQLDEIVLHPLGPAPLPTPTKTTAEQILIHGTNDAALVQLEAQLLQEPANSARPQLILRDGSVIFTAQLQNRAVIERVLRFRAGSLLRLTGICAIQGNDRHEPQTFRLLVAQPSGVQLLHAPSSLTWRHLAFGAAGLAFAAMFILAWIASLRRQVRSRTEALAYERHLLTVLFDNLPDAVYFKDRQSRFVRFSKSFGRLFNVPDLQSIHGKTDFDFFTEEHARAAFDDEQEIISTGAPIVGKIEKETHLDGRVTWALTSKMPWRNDHGQIIGTFGVSKDVTPIKEAELKLEDLHKQLLQTSRQAGMAEVATSILHNVGNVLNSVNVSTSLLLERASNCKTADLSRVAALLKQHSADLGAFLTSDSKGAQVPLYLEQLAAYLAREQDGFVAELSSLAKNIDHVKTIIAMQQSYAKVAGVFEIVHPAELIEDALRCNSGALTRHQVEIVRHYDPQVPAITTDKHKVLQILVNIVRNAKYACDDSQRPDKQITVVVGLGHGCVNISVTDNGIGIPEENLTRIFNLGFSTRREGHGFGLHSSALAAQDLGGSLVASSPGPGQGATFTLELPLSQRPEAGPTVNALPEPRSSPNVTGAEHAPCEPQPSEPCLV